jgi:hypothetical protein
MNTAWEVIAQAIAEHRFDGDMFECWCQRDLPDAEVVTMDRDEHAAHVASVVVGVLTANGWALTKLPEPDDTGSGKDGEFDAWWAHYPNNNGSQPSKWPNWVICAADGDVHLGTWQMHPAKARAMAAALLAAANAVEVAAVSPTQRESSGNE